MPKIKVDHVVSFSSEDCVHVANNILTADPNRKWRCQTPGETSAYIILQLEKAEAITAIDIGNEHSAYIEVLVARSGNASKDSDYKVLLVMSSFMSPIESRQSTNKNKVRMFTAEQLTPECKQKWDRVKIVCTQPFNRHVQYGLSFVALHSAGDKTNECGVTDSGSLSKTSDSSLTDGAKLSKTSDSSLTDGAKLSKTKDSSLTDGAKLSKTSESGLTSVGKFALRPDSPGLSQVGSSFEKWKEERGSKLWKDAAAILQASEKPDKTPPKTDTKLPKPKLPLNTAKQKPVDGPVSPPARNRNDLFYSKDEEQPNTKIDKIMEETSKEVARRKEMERKNESERKRKNDDKNKQASSKDVSRKKETEDTKTKKEFSNISPSAKRKNASSADSSRKKLKKCIKKPFGRLLGGVVFVISGIQNPDRAMIRGMALNMGAKYEPDWKGNCTHLICAFPNTPKFNQVRGKGKIVTKKWIEDCHSQRKRLPWRRYALDRNDHGKPESEEEILEETEEETSERCEETVGEAAEDSIRDSGSDTEAQVARIQELQQKKNKLDKTVEKNVYDDDTEDEILEKNCANFDEELPQFFKSVTFYIDPKMDQSDRNYLARCITAYGGLVETVPYKTINIIITDNKNSISNKDLFNKPVEYVNSEWICNSILEKKMLPY